MTAAASVARIRRELRSRGTAGAKSGSASSGLLAVTCLLAAMTLWIAGLPLIDPAGLNDLGLAAILPWTGWAALGLLGAGFTLSLRRGTVEGGLPCLFLVGLVLALHATPAIAYGTLRYSWAWKHIGVVDFIQRHGWVDPDATFLAVYHNWPGFFLAAAFVADRLGLHPLEIADLARFTPLALNLAYLCALPPILRQLTADPRLVWSATWIFLAGNWVGQDYFSPQGTTFLLYLVALGLCLGPLQSAAARGEASSGFFGRIACFAWSRPERRFGRVTRIAAAAAFLALVPAIGVSHQLTPIMLVVALGGLAAFGWLSPGYCIYALLIEALCLLYLAGDFMATAMTEIVAEFGHTAPEIMERLVDSAEISDGQALVSLAVRLLTGAIAIAALMGGVRRLCNGFRDGPAVVLVAAALTPLVITSYGGEIVFRVFLFALPFLAFFAAALFFASPQRIPGVIGMASFAAFAVLLAVGFVFANNGKDRQYWFSPDEIATARWLYESAPPESLLVEGARNYPSQFMNYENFVYVTLAEESPHEQAELLSDPVGTLGRWLDDDRWSAGFVIITRSQKAYVDSLGIMPPGSLDEIERALLASPRFEVVRSSPGATVFALDPLAEGMGGWLR